MDLKGVERFEQETDSKQDVKLLKSQLASLREILFQHFEDLEMQAGSTTALEEYVEWINEVPSFANYRNLSCLYRLHDRVEDALNALKRASKYPLTSGGDRTEDFVASDSYWYAYRNGSYQLAIKICDEWERVLQARGSDDEDYLVLRAIRAMSQRALRDETSSVPLNQQPNSGNGNYVDDTSLDKLQLFYQEIE